MIEVRFSLSAVRFALLLCAMDQQLFGQQMPVSRKAAPLFSGDKNRVVWGYKC